MKVTLLTANSAAFAGMASVTLPSKVDFCLQHGYSLVAKALEPTAISVQRARLWCDILRHTEPGEWIWFTGSDVKVTNIKYDLSQLVEDDKELVVGEYQGILNCDSMLFKNTELVKELMDSVYTSWPSWGTHFRQEEGALEDRVRRECYAPRVKIVPNKVLNAFPPYSLCKQDMCWSPGDLALHALNLGGEVSMTKRMEWLKSV